MILLHHQQQQQRKHYHKCNVVVPSLLLLLLLLLHVCHIQTVLTYAAAANTNTTITTTTTTLQPLVFASIGDYGNTSLMGVLQGAAASGIQLSFNLANTNQNGIQGRKLKFITRNTDGDPERVLGHLADIATNVSNFAGLLFTSGERAIRTIITYIDSLPTDEEKFTIIQPIVGTREWFQFSKNYINLTPSPDAELLTMMRHIVYKGHYSRIALATDSSNNFGTELLPDIKRLLTEVGANLTYHFTMDVTVSTTSYDLVSFSKMAATRPHVVILYGILHPVTMYVALAVLVQMPDSILISSVGLMPLLDFGIRTLPTASANNIVSNRLYITYPEKLYTDTTFQFVRTFRAHIDALNTTTTTTTNTSSSSQLTLQYLDANPSFGNFVFYGYVVGQMVLQILNKIQYHPNITRSSIRNSIFQDSIFATEDTVYGPFSGECIASRSLFCNCSNGARTTSLMEYTATLEMRPVPNSQYVLPLTSCLATNISIPSVLVAALVSESNNSKTSQLVTEYMLGCNASDFNNENSAVIAQTYTGNSTAALQALNTEKLLTASAGSVLNTPIGDATGIGAVIDPMEVRPRLYGGFRRDVVYVSPTYEQELHALASLAVAQGKGITVLSALDEDGSAVGSTLTRSMNTLGKEGGGHRSSASIASGLLATGDGGATILHGITTSADIAAIATHLGQQTNAVVAIPMAHLLVWYRELVAAVTDEGQRSRIVFATSLPNWAGPVSGETTGPALQTYFDRVPATNRTPGSLRGFMMHQLLTYVTGRIPNQKTPTEFLRMLYGASVVVMDTGLAVGPFNDEPCTLIDGEDSSSNQQAASITCEMNIGARVIHVRSLQALIPVTLPTPSPLAPDTFGADELTITTSSGRIQYQALAPSPTSDSGTSILFLDESASRTALMVVVSIISALIVVALVVSVLVLCYCRRPNWVAPKDESEAFTIVFTDIQSSTALWAEVLDAMAPAIDNHHALIRKLCKKHHGYEVKTIGDAFMIAFKDAPDATEFAYKLQFEFFDDERWSAEIDRVYVDLDRLATATMKPEEQAVYSNSLSPEDYRKIWNGLRIRIGIHTGFGQIKKDPVSHGNDYYGTVVNSASRIQNAAYGGQILLSKATLVAAGLSPQEVKDVGEVKLRGVPKPVYLYELITIPNRPFPPPRGAVNPHTTKKKKQREVIAAADGSSPREDYLSHQNIITNNNNIINRSNDTMGSSTNYNEEEDGGQSMFSNRTQSLWGLALPLSIQREQEHIVAVLKTMLAVLPEKHRMERLSELCERWHVLGRHHTIRGNGGEEHGSESSFQQQHHLVENLATALAPIIARKFDSLVPSGQASNCGGIAVADDDRNGGQQYGTTASDATKIMLSSGSCAPLLEEQCQQVVMKNPLYSPLSSNSIDARDDSGGGGTYLASSTATIVTTTHAAQLVTASSPAPPPVSNNDYSNNHNGTTPSLTFNRTPTAPHLQPPQRRPLAPTVINKNANNPFAFNPRHINNNSSSSNGNRNGDQNHVNNRNITMGSMTSPHHDNHQPLKLHTTTPSSSSNTIGGGGGSAAAPPRSSSEDDNTAFHFSTGGTGVGLATSSMGSHEGERGARASVSLFRNSIRSADLPRSGGNGGTSGGHIGGSSNRRNVVDGSYMEVEDFNEYMSGGVGEGGNNDDDGTELMTLSQQDEGNHHHQHQNRPRQLTTTTTMQQRDSVEMAALHRALNGLRK